MELPVDIPAPTWGRYVVFGNVYGLDRPVVFQAETRTSPWGYEVLVPLALLVLAQVLRRRERVRRLDAEQLAMTRARTPPLVQSSPLVVMLDERRSSEPVYDQPPRPEPRSAAANDVVTVST
jgi:hypothetical protein